MYVLGVETSCDETSLAVVEDGRRILSNVVASSLSFHKKYGGIVPEIASRMQLEAITAVAESAVKEAGIKLRDLGLIGVVSGPGLAGSLLVGVSFAKSLSLGLGIPLLGIDHLQSHIYANYLNGISPNLKKPFVGLIVSGGHTSLYYVRDFDDMAVLGSTCDDACGEAFDKVAKILRLGYPGGPVIEKIARKGNPRRIKFNCSDTHNPLDFSFSGIKTAVLYYVQRTGKRKITADIAASFQEAVVDTLIKKSVLALRMKKSKSLVVGGGVAANHRLREKFAQRAAEGNFTVHFPRQELCMDNAAMVAGLAWRLFKKGRQSGLDLAAVR